MTRERFKQQIACVYRRIAPRRPAELVPILCYHSVQVLDRSHCVAPDRFEVQIAYLKANFRLLRLGELVDELQAGRLRGPVAAVTFDDGYEDNYTQAFPILARHGCPATIFLPTAFIEREVMLIKEPGFDPLTWEQIHTMRRAGIEFGAHGHTHSILRGLTGHPLRLEIVGSKAILERELGETINLFAYPNGQRPDFDKRTVRALMAAGFRAACSTLWGTGNTARSLFALKRVIIDRSDDMNTFRMKTCGSYDYLGILHSMKPRGKLLHLTNTGIK